MWALLHECDHPENWKIQMVWCGAFLHEFDIMQAQYGSGGKQYESVVISMNQVVIRW